MKTAALTILIPVMTFAQTVLIQQGEKVFDQTCATGYCHGAKGATGGAPRLAARGFDKQYIDGTIARGIPGTAMRAFAGTLTRADLGAVEAYVESLNGLSSPGAAPRAPKALSPEASRGHDLFFDPVRSFGRCATCHEINGVGIPVANPILTIPANAAALRALATPRVRTAVIGEESMPVLVVSDTKRGTILYDLTSAPPVQRSLDPGSAKLTEGGNWKHASFIASYNDAELAAILAYLRAEIR